MKPMARWTDLELETLGKMTLFQAQVLRDAFLDKSFTETDAELAERTGVPADVVRDARLCRMKSLVPAEVPTRELKQLLRNYRSVLERHEAPPAGVEPPAKAARLRLNLPREVLAHAEAVLDRL